MAAYINKSKGDDWATPKNIYSKYMENGFFDPCPLFSPFDGLSIEWKEKNFVNPPYSKLKKWIKKAIEENKKEKKVVLLIPSRTDTKAFEMLYKHGCEFCFIIGRLHFNDKEAAPFPSVIVDLCGGAKIRSHLQALKTGKEHE